MADQANRRQYHPGSPGPVARSFARYIASHKSEEFPAVKEHFGGEHGPGLAQALFSFHNDWQRWRGLPESGDGVLSERQLEEKARDEEKQQLEAQKAAEKAAKQAEKEKERAEKASKREQDEAERKAKREAREREQAEKREAKERERAEKAAAAEAKRAEKEAERAAKQAAAEAQTGADGDDSTSDEGDAPEVGRGALRESKLRKKGQTPQPVGAGETPF